MHIGLFCGTLPGRQASSGIATYVNVMRSALMDAGHRVTVVTFAESQTGNAAPRATGPRCTLRHRIQARVAALQPSVGATPGAAGALAAHFAALHAGDPFDIVEMEESFGWSDTVARALPVPVVTRLHGPHLYGRDSVETPASRRISERRIRVEGRAIARAAAITSPSARLLAATVTDYALEPRLAEVIPNPINLAPAAACWTAEGCDPQQILHLGRFDSRKGADISIAAFARALRRRPDLRLIIAGPDRGVSMANGTPCHFHQYAQDHVSPTVRARLRFLGPVTSEDVVRLRRGSAVSLVPSRFENFAYSIAEAMAAGAPTIVSNSFGNTEMIEEGITGKVVPVADIDATAAALVWMIDHPEQAAAMGQRLRERCAAWLNPGIVAQQTLAFYLRAIAMHYEYRGRGNPKSKRFAVYDERSSAAPRGIGSDRTSERPAR